MLPKDLEWADSTLFFRTALFNYHNVWKSTGPIPQVSVTLFAFEAHPCALTAFTPAWTSSAKEGKMNSGAIKPEANEANWPPKVPVGLHSHFSSGPIYVFVSHINLRAHSWCRPAADVPLVMHIIPLTPLSFFSTFATNLPLVQTAACVSPGATLNPCIIWIN